MTLSDLSIKNPVFAWMLMTGLMVFGWIGFSRMGVSQLPDVDFPVVTVTVTWEPCDCPAAQAARGGHVKVRCNTPGCVETWWSPLHRPEPLLLGHRDDPCR